MHDKLNFQNRRDFLKKTTLAVLGSSIVYPAILSAKPKFNKVLKVGLIGCGGRGTGAAAQALTADPDVVLTALGDVFEDKLEESLTSLQQIHPERTLVEESNRFIGFDSYQKVIDSDVDVVLLTAPPAFRPLHFEYAVQKNKHIFCEKPVAVDGPGVRRIIEAAKIAKQKQLNVVSGFCFRYENANRATFGKITTGELGKIRSISTFRNGGELWYVPREKGWTDMTYYMRNWYYYNALSGDIVVEQAVHSIDMMSWAMGDKLPVKAMGTGGRQVRTDPKYGNIYDHFAVEFEYADGAKGFHFTRQQAGTTSRNSVDVLGVNGMATINIGSKYEIKGQQDWKYRGPKNNMYQTQHDELFEAIRKGHVLDDSDHMVNSTLLAILARDVCYSGKAITLEEALASNVELGPKIEDYDWDLNWTPNPVAKPGHTQVI